MRPLRLRSDPWSAIWPADRGALGRALAVAAAFPALVGPLTIAVTGDVTSALAGLVEDLGGQGLEVDDLPRVELVGVEAPAEALHIGRLVADLSASCEYERRPWLPVFEAGDTLHGRVWAAAERALRNGAGRVTILAEEIDRPAMPAERHRITVVSGNPGLRRTIRRQGMAARPRPPAAPYLPCAEVVVADARRPEDLTLVHGYAGSVHLVNDEHLTPAARLAFGLPVQSPSDSASSVATSTTRRSAPTLCTPSSSITVQ